MSFSFPSYRSLRKYLGELDAFVELTELASRDFQMHARKSASVQAFVEEASSRHGIRVNMTELDQLSAHLARHYIVTVYQSAERFLHEFRREHTELHDKQWADDRKLDPLSNALKHVSASEGEAEAAIGKDLIGRFQYYRLVRNWVLHAKDTDADKLVSKHAELGSYSSEHKELFESTPGPHLPSELTFVDFILFSRITKEIGERLCELSIPDETRWAKVVSLDRFKHVKTSPKRMRKAIAGWLHTEYGMDVDTAEGIAGGLVDPLA